MKTFQLIFSLTLTFLTASQPFGQAQCPGNVAILRYHSFGSSKVAIPVMINQSGPYEFLLDTGAQISVVEPSLAEELHLEPRGNANAISVAANATAQLVALDLVEVGSFAVHQQIEPLVGDAGCDLSGQLYGHVVTHDGSPRVTTCP